MKTIRVEGTHDTQALRQALLEAGIPAEWQEGDLSFALVVQQHEDLAVAAEEPVLDDEYEFVPGPDGRPETHLVWRDLDGQPVEVDAPEGAVNGAHVQTGPGWLTVMVPDGTDALAAQTIEEAT